MEGPMPYADCLGEPPLLDDKEEIAQAEELWEDVIVGSKNPKDDDGCVIDMGSITTVDYTASITTEDFEAYEKQLFESDGFDVDSFRGFAFGMITPSYCPKEKLSEHYSGYAEIAIKEYNKKKDKNFKVVGIEKANLQVSSIFNYYITFAAVDEKAFDNKPIMFQALVTEGEGDEPCVEICRQKCDPSEGYSMYAKV